MTKVEKAVSLDTKVSGTSLFRMMSGFLDALDKPLLVAERSGQILHVNLPAQTSFRFQDHGASHPNLFRDILHIDGNGLLGQLEGGEQEVNLQIESTDGRARARIRWLPETDWLIVFADSEPAGSSEDQEQMKRQVQDLLHEREITYRNLLAAYLRLQEVNRQKTIFLGSAAHELKTPLAVMKGYYDLLLSGSLGGLSEKQREILSESKQSCDRLVRLVSTFLNYTALESGKLVLQFQDNDLKDCLSDVGVRWRESFQRANVQFEVLLNPTLPVFKFDYPKIQQCVTNLVDNALKHTPQGGKVTLRAEPHFWERRASPVKPSQERRSSRPPQANSVIVTVKDTGKGIAPEFHQEIFEEFGRVDHSSSGMGLGLAITKRLIQAHQGKIWVESEPGRGSSFNFLLPTKVEAYGHT